LTIRSPYLSVVLPYVLGSDTLTYNGIQQGTTYIRRDESIDRQRDSLVSAADGVDESESSEEVSQLSSV
jgi:hypothetical protein